MTQAEFCVRPDLVSRLRGYIEARHNAVVNGERRTGKTSLIDESARRIGV